MKVDVKLFAIAKQIAGTETISVELASHSTVLELRAALGRQHSELSDVVQRAMIAIDTQYVNNDAIVSENSEIALIPPVSGG